MYGQLNFPTAILRACIIKLLLVSNEFPFLCKPMGMQSLLEVGEKEVNCK